MPPFNFSDVAIATAQACGGMYLLILPDTMAAALVRLECELRRQLDEAMPGE